MAAPSRSITPRRSRTCGTLTLPVEFVVFHRTRQHPPFWMDSPVSKSQASSSARACYSSFVDAAPVIAVLRAFEREGVCYKVVGAVALNLAGLPRATQDLDIFVTADEKTLNVYEKRCTRCSMTPQSTTLLPLTCLGNIQPFSTFRRQELFTLIF